MLYKGESLMSPVQKKTNYLINVQTTWDDTRRCYNLGCSRRVDELVLLLSEGSEDAVAVCFEVEDISGVWGGGDDWPGISGCWKTSAATAGQVAIEQFRHNTLQTRCGFLGRVAAVAVVVTEGSLCRTGTSSTTVRSTSVSSTGELGW